MVPAGFANASFFPTAKGIARCRKLFRGFREAAVLERSKHVPAPEAFPRIESLVAEWLLTESIKLMQ